MKNFSWYFPMPDIANVASAVAQPQLAKEKYNGSTARFNSDAHTGVDRTGVPRPRRLSLGAGNVTVSDVAPTDPGVCRGRRALPRDAFTLDAAGLG